MSLLQEIQESLLNEKSDLGPVLLKLRFLVARLGSDVLEDWVQHEINGYPAEVVVPDYRRAPISYSGTFSDGFRVLNNVSIPEYHIKKHASENWLRIAIRDPLSVIDDMVARTSDDSNDGEKYGVSTGNLRLLLQNKVYQNSTMIEMFSEFKPGVFVQIQSIVRAKVLELTLELEKAVPGAADIVIGKKSDAPEIDSKRVANVADQFINYGTVTNVQSSGDHATINVQVAQGDKAGLVRALTDGGLPSEDAAEFAEIVSSEEADRENKTFGKRAQEWLGEKIAQGGMAAWKVGLTVATELLTKGAVKYYGLDT